MTPWQLYFRNMHAEFCIFTCNTMLVTSSKLPVFAFHFVSDSVCYGSRTELQQRWFFWGTFCLWAGVGRALTWSIWFFSWTASRVLFCLNSVQKMHENGQPLFFVSKFSFQTIRLFACTLSFLKLLEVEGEMRFCSMLTAFKDFFQVAVKNSNSDILISWTHSL